MKHFADLFTTGGAVVNDSTQDSLLRPEEAPSGGCEYEHLVGGHLGRQPKKEIDCCKRGRQIVDGLLIARQDSFPESLGNPKRRPLE